MTNESVTTNTATKGPTAIVLMAIPIPMVLTALVMTSSMLVGRIGLLHLSLISIVPFAVGFGTGIYVANRMFRTKLVKRIMLGFYFLATYVTMIVSTLWVPIPFMK